MPSSSAGVSVSGSPASSAPVVLFLDIDGVLNRTENATHILLEPDLVERLRVLVEKTQCRIVLSTFWRHFEEYIQYILYRHSIPANAIIGRTPGSSHIMRHASWLDSDPADAGQYMDRATEIAAWLKEHPDVIRFAILDDRASAASDPTLTAHFVQTDATVGLSDADVAACRAILLGDDAPTRDNESKAVIVSPLGDALMCALEVVATLILPIVLVLVVIMTSGKMPGKPQTA